MKKLISIIVPLSALIFTGCGKQNNSQISLNVNNKNAVATINWDWDNGETIISKTCPVGEVPDYDYSHDGIPKKAHPDQDKCYVFNGWNPAVDIADKEGVYNYTATYVTRSITDKYTITFDCAECMINGRYHIEEKHTAGDLPLTYHFVLPSGNFVRAYPAEHCVQVKNAKGEIVNDCYLYDETKGELIITKLESDITIEAIADYACACLTYQYYEGYEAPITIKPGPNANITYIDWGDGSFPEKSSDGTFVHAYHKKGPDFDGSYSIRIYQDRSLTSFILSDETSAALGTPLSAGDLYISSIDYYYVEGIPIQIADYAFAHAELLGTLNLSRIPYVVSLGYKGIYGTLLDGYSFSGAQYAGTLVHEGLCDSYERDSTWQDNYAYVSIVPTPEYFEEKLLGIPLELTIRSTYFDVYFSVGSGQYIIFRAFIKPEYSSFYHWPSGNLTASFLQADGQYYDTPLGDSYITHKCHLFNTFRTEEIFYYYYPDDSIKFDITLDLVKVNYMGNGGKINGQDKYVTFGSVGSTPVHPTTSSAAITHDSDDKYQYTFAGWDKDPMVISGEQTYHALWTATPKDNFDITWYDNDKTTKLGKTSVAYLAPPIGDEFADVAYKLHDEDNHYSFSSWKEIGTDAPLNVAIKDTSYYADFEVNNNMSIKFNGTNVVEKITLKDSFVDLFTYRDDNIVTYNFTALNDTKLPNTISVSYKHPVEGLVPYDWDADTGRLTIDQSLLNDDIIISIVGVA